MFATTTASNAVSFGQTLHRIPADDPQRGLRADGRLFVRKQLRKAHADGLRVRKVAQEQLQRGISSVRVRGHGIANYYEMKICVCVCVSAADRTRL